MSDYKTKTFHYKTAMFFNTDKKLNLQDLLAESLNFNPRAIDRQETVGEENLTFRLINTHRKQGNLLCGVMFSYTKGQNQNIVDIDENAKELPIEQVAPPPNEKTKARTEFIEGMFYFGILKNHVVIVGSSKLQSEQFEHHLNWILHKNETVLDAKTMVSITDPIQPKLTKKSMDNPRSIKFSQPMKFDTIVATDNEKKSISIIPSKKIWSAIETLIKNGCGVSVPEMNLPTNIQEKDVCIDLEIKWKKRRDYSQKQTPFLSQIAHAFRHIDTPPFTLVTRNGFTIKGKDCKVQNKIACLCINGIPNNEFIFAKILTWLQQLAADKDIIPE